MAFNGSGVFSRLYNWATEQLSSPIEIAKLDAQEEDIATALSNCILRDGTGNPTAAIDWNSQKITSLADAAAATDAMNRQFSDARYGQRIWAAKATDTSRSLTTSYADDPDLNVTLATGVYQFQGHLLAHDSAAGGQLKWQFANTATFGNGTRFYLQAGGAGGNFTDSGVVNFTTNLAGATGLSASSPKVYYFNGTAVVTVAGNLRLQWAQVFSNATATVMMAGSYLSFVKLA